MTLSRFNVSKSDASLASVLSVKVDFLPWDTGLVEFLSGYGFMSVGVPLDYRLNRTQHLGFWEGIKQVVNGPD